MLQKTVTRIKEESKQSVMNNADVEREHDE